MVTKKSGAKKKADAQKTRQGVIRSGRRDVADEPCNKSMVCDKCKKHQKNRMFCYFCQAQQQLPMCGHCGKTKCLSANGGECLVAHHGTFATGMAMVGAICDFCEAPVCHSRKCVTKHSCPCPLMNSTCIECKRDLWSHGGRVFKCAFCDAWLCEDDHNEHLGTCQTLDGDSYKCVSCSKQGSWVCLKCKIPWCDSHVESKITKFEKGKGYTCKKCHAPLAEAKALSISVRQLDFGRQSADTSAQAMASSSGRGTFSFGGVTVGGQGNDEDEEFETNRLSNMQTEEWGDYDDYDEDEYGEEYGEYDDEEGGDDEEEEEGNEEEEN